MELNEVKRYSSAPQDLLDCNFACQHNGLPHSILKVSSSGDFTSFSFNGLLIPDFSPTASSLSNLSPSFDAHSRDPHQQHHAPLGVTHDRRMKRMISNRESARRSRLRKKKQIEELQGQVDHLRAVNSQFSEKLIALLESNHQILQENAVLKEKVSSLQEIVAGLLTPFRKLDDISNRANYRKSEPSNHTH